MSIIVGSPHKPKPEPDERVGYYIHDNATAYLDGQPDGVYVDVKDKDGEVVYRRKFDDAKDALSYIENKKQYYLDKGKEDT